MTISTTEFKVNKTDIPGLLDIDVSLIEDERGWFQEKYQNKKLFLAGFPNFWPIQQNVSYNKDVGVIRGIHAEPWNKYISVISGAVFAVFVDLRPGNDYLKKVMMVIDEKKAVFVPKGVGNSFQTQVPDTIYSYLVDAHWSADKMAEYKYLNVADPALNIRWPIPLENAIISDKDRNCPMLSEVDGV